MCRSICSKKEQEASAAKRKGAQEEAGAGAVSGSLDLKGKT